MAEIIDSLIEKEMQNSYIDYAMSVIIGRALPDARDGLKPAQRRILWAMYGLSNFHDQPTKKSARIVGEVLGKYHPHGDIAAYETLVRMAQDFSLNHTLVQGQGNFGSVDGDAAASARYTEVRLNRLAEEMLQDLDKKAVPFVPNFDNTETEPLILPAKVPNLLLNGAAGIAVGVATNILPHNLREVCDAVTAYVDNKEITPQELLQYIKGPDLPTGGIIFHTGNLTSSYLGGRGSCIIRGKTVIEENKGKSSIIITEIPYMVNKASMVEKIAELVRDKRISGITNLRDESGKEGIRIVIDLRKDVTPEAILNTLYKHTQLQVSTPIMNIAVVGNSLITFNIKQFIKTFVDHRVEVIKNRTKYDLGVATDRLHIVQGLLTAIHDIDSAVAIIRKASDSKEAKAALIAGFSLSEKQASAILDMKLAKLTSLESSALETEGKELGESIKYYSDILGSEQKIYQIIKDETKDIRDKYGRDRRTVIDYSTKVEEIENEDLIQDEDVTVILTNNNYMKRLPTKLYKAQGRGGKGVIAIQLRENDYVRQIVSCMSKDYLLALTSKGRAYWLKAYQVPEEGKYSLGKAAVNLISLAEGEKVEMLINTRSFENKFLTFITAKGKIKRLRAEKFAKPRSSGIIAMPLLDDDSIADVCISDGSSNLFIATKLGKALRFEEKDLRPMSRISHGVRGIRLSQNDEVVNVLSAKESDMVATITENGSGKITELSRYRLQHRGGKGVINLRVRDKTGGVVKSLKVNHNDYILIVNSAGLSIQFPVTEIRVTGRGASGVRLMKVEKGAVVVDAQIISREEAVSVPKGTLTQDPSIDPDNGQVEMGETGAA
jgi:DNA gyrase subunit A